MKSKMKQTNSIPLFKKMLLKISNYVYSLKIKYNNDGVSRYLVNC